MITVNDKVYRNLQEQVAKNQADIEDLNSLNIVGIKVVGEVQSVLDLPNPEVYPGEYGDAYYVGPVGSGSLYVLTRANAVEPATHWFNLGQFPKPGIQGPEGPQGEQGERGASTRWYAIPGNPVQTEGYNPGDIVVNVITYDLFMLEEGNTPFWSRLFNIRGPQGIQGQQGLKGDKGDKGDKGEKGDRGPVANTYIRGIVSSSSQLPLPTVLQDITAAYLVGSTTPYNLYVQIGEDLESMTWTNLGEFNNGTTVRVNGTGVAVFDADSKIDKSTAINGSVYVKDYSGNTSYKKYAADTTGDTIALRDTSGKLQTATPTGTNDAVNKQYADNNYIPKSVLTNNQRVLIKNSNGVIGQAEYNTLPVSYAFATRDAGGQLNLPMQNTVAREPSIDQAISKRYADNHYMTPNTLDGYLGSSLKAQQYIFNINDMTIESLSGFSGILYLRSDVFASDSEADISDAVSKCYTNWIFNRNDYRDQAFVNIAAFCAIDAEIYDVSAGDIMRFIPASGWVSKSGQNAYINGITYVINEEDNDDNQTKSMHIQLVLSLPNNPVKLQTIGYLDHIYEGPDVQPNDQSTVFRSSNFNIGGAEDEKTYPEEAEQAYSNWWDN